MPEESGRQSAIDNEHLKLLSWGYIISGCIAAGISIFGLFYAFMGIFMGVVFSHAPVGRAAQGAPRLYCNSFRGHRVGLLHYDHCRGHRQVLDGALHQSAPVADFLLRRRGDHLHGISPRHGAGRPLPVRSGTPIGDQVV